MAPLPVLIVDDHPALRAGLRGLLEQEPGVVFAGAVASERELVHALPALKPDVVIMDYALARGDGLSACFRIKQLPNPPAVVLYTAYADSAFAVPAAVAQADAVVSKSAPVETLLHAIHEVGRGAVMVAQPDPEFLEAASARLVEDDLPVLGMLFARVPVVEIAETLGVSAGEVKARALRIIGEMQASDRIALAAQ
jgi:DNA-binding NarL/FixJ family response regulator